MFSKSSRARLTRHDLPRFPGQSLFDRLARAVCEAGCLPRKELFEAWEMARRVRRHLRGRRVVDIAGGHGLLAHALLLLDDSSPSAVVVDPDVPASATKVCEAIVAVWPRLAGRVTFLAQDLEHLPLSPRDLVVSSHACGALTDRVLERAAAVRAPVAVLPCCHNPAVSETGGLDAWLDAALAIDVKRAQRLQSLGYQTWLLTIPDEITPQNRLLVGAPE
jgi:Methyltransferase domain